MIKGTFSAGHSLTTSGKETPDGMKEWEFNSKVVSYAINELANYEGIAILRLDDPSGRADIPLSVRSDRSNAYVADFHIDVHANAYGNTWNDANGIETFVNELDDKKSVELAKLVQSGLIHHTGLRDRGVKEANGNLHMLREVKAPVKILVEAGFMTNRKEVELLKSDEYRRLVAKCIVEAIIEFYNLKKREVKPQVTTTKQTTSFPKAQTWVKAQGISDGSRPKDPVTREEVWEMLRRMEEKK